MYVHDGPTTPDSDRPVCVGTGDPRVLGHSLWLRLVEYLRVIVSVKGCTTVL